MKGLVAAALVLGLAAPASATVIDFTADNATMGNVLGIDYAVSFGGGAGANAVHDNNVDCDTPMFGGAGLACSAVSGGFDVGFGVTGGGNGEEIDGSLTSNNGAGQFVEVSFTAPIRVTGFAGMLTYRNDGQNEEQVILEYRLGGGAFTQIVAFPQALINQNPGGDSSFDTVGLAFQNGLDVVADLVRFRAGGIGTADDRSFNVTAAALEVAPVPLPAGVTLMLAGMGAFGFVARRKKRLAA